MKADAKALFSKVIDFDEYREFWRKGKALVELQVHGPIMNLISMVYTDNSSTEKVNHKNFKLGKIMQSMTDLPEFDFIPHVISTNIQLKLMFRWTDLYNQLHGAGYCLHPEFQAYNHNHTT